MDFDLGYLYEISYKYAKVAVLGAPSSTFGLEDISGDVSALETAFANPLSSKIIVNAVLAGSVAALRERNARPVLSTFPLDALKGTAIVPADVDLARSWVLASVESNLDEDAQEQFISETLPDFDSAADMMRTMSSLALVIPIVAAQVEMS